MTGNQNEAKKIFSAVEEISKGELQSAEDVERLIGIAVTNNKLDLLEQLSFQAKFSKGLFQIIRNSSNEIDPEYFKKIEAELTESIGKIKNLFSEIISDSDNFIKNIFEEKYFSMTRTSLSNLSILCEDLGYLKLYFNDLKRRG